MGAYASVTKSILSRISGCEIPMIQGKVVCPPHGQFEIILYKGLCSGLRVEHQSRSVRLWFSYPNLYLEAFKSNGVWYRFRNFHPQTVLAGAPAHMYQVEELPFEAGYHRCGLRADWAVLRFGQNTIFDIYKAQRDYPNNPGAMYELKLY